MSRHFIPRNSVITPGRTIGLAMLIGFGLSVVSAQDTDQASINSSIGEDGTGRIVVEARGQLPKPPVLYTATADATAQCGTKSVDQTIELAVRIVQGDAVTLSFGIHGQGSVTAVIGKNLRSWSVRQEGKNRFLDLHVKDKVTELKVSIKTRSKEFSLRQPAVVQLTHLTPGKSVGFHSLLTVTYAAGVKGAVQKVTGFAPLDADDETNRFQTATGGQLSVMLTRDGAAAGPVELTDVKLDGKLHANGDSMHFQLGGTAVVTEADAELVILSGKAAVSTVPTNDNYRLRLTHEGRRPVYQLIFPKAGSFPVTLDFVAAVSPPSAQVRGMDFTIAASAVVPLMLTGMESDLEFGRDQESVVPQRDGDTWRGFLPATGRAKLHWKQARKTGEGKLFFSTTAQVEAQLGAGLLRQNHQIDFQVLQGELDALRIELQGPGEILDVQGSNIVAWKITQQDNRRVLEATLNQPITGTSQIVVRSQTPLGAFPVRVEGLRLNPVGAIRHSGYLRLSNSGSVRLEPTALSGMTQLAPEQFPGNAIKARQIFVYRFPAAEHMFSVAADRVEPEVAVSELVVYQLAETDRVIRADIELDIREAPLRAWDFGIPADYSVVSVTGASVADYIAASAVNDGQRNLKVVFGKDISGRQLVKLHLEKSEAAAAGDWVLPPIKYPDAKSVRGAIGVVGAPGYRIAPGETNLLVDKPLSYFPKPSPNLQQAFRIREPGWSATMQIELLDRSIQADVFHLYSLSQETVYGSALINYFVTGAPVSEWKIALPQSMGNVIVDGRDVRTSRREDDTLIVSLHQPVMGAYTLLVTFEEKPDADTGTFQAGRVSPIGVQGERGYVQVVSPMQVEIETASVSDDLLKLDPLELPAEFRLLSSAPALGTWQYTDRPFDLDLKVTWFEPGSTLTQIVEFSEAQSRVSRDGELVTDVLYYVKSRGRSNFRIRLPEDPVRLWGVSVNGRPVTARQADDAMLIPLPGGSDPNIPVAVSLQLGKPAVRQSRPELQLPVIFAPVLKTQWNITGDEHHVLVPSGGTVTPPIPVLRPTGFHWVAKQGVLSLFLIGLFSAMGIWLQRPAPWWRLLRLASLVIAMFVSYQAACAAFADRGSPAPLQLSLPVLSAEESVELNVNNTPLWRVNVSWLGVIAAISGMAMIVWSYRRQKMREIILFRGGGILLIALGVLLQGEGAPWFYGLLAISIFLLLFVRPAKESLGDLWRWIKGVVERRRARKAEQRKQKEAAAAAGPATAVMMLIAASLMTPASLAAETSTPEGFHAADSVTQKWQLAHETGRLTASGEMTLSGVPGEQFVLLRAPAVLTAFDGKGLRVTQRNVAGFGLTYIVSIPLPDKVAEADDKQNPKTADYKATFAYHLEATQPTKGLKVLTGLAAVQEIELTYDEADWDVVCATAVSVEQLEVDDATRAKILPGPGENSISLKPRARDVSVEKTQFFVEASNLYLPAPGVVDGRHQLNIRTSQGQVSQLSIVVPAGLTVSAVGGPVGSWQFDADSGSLKLAIEPAQAKLFQVLIETQRSLDPLPTDVSLAPLRVDDATGEVGLVAIAFGPEAQPETLTPNVMSAVNLGDFNPALLSKTKAVLHRVYRYGVDGGDVAVRVAPVASEVRVVSEQVLSLGDERVVLAVNFAAEISRAGLFQLSFPLPDGFEVESLTGAALHHWSELTEDGQRQIVLHLNGKTIGTQSFALSLSGTTPADVAQWELPRFELNEAARQTGNLVVRPTTGIRLRTITRQNVSETDPRTMGGAGQGALAFRLLQRDWNLVLAVEKLDPWVTGQILHEVTLREGQTRSTLLAALNVQNASIRSLQVSLPLSNPDEIKTLRASGRVVSDMIRTGPNSNVWEVQFKRRLVGKLQFRIEYERRGERANEDEVLTPATFPEVRQLAYYYAVRAGGRLELTHDALTQGWQRMDWNTVPGKLREAENRSVPALTFRAIAPREALTVHTQRHSLADALKLRVAKGALTTILSPTGDQLTAVDVTMEVIQRSNLRVGLPKDGELVSIFVNGESVNSIRLDEATNAWQFYILPGIDDRTAQVRFVYSVPGSQLSGLQLGSPSLNVPLENIQWKVIAPRGFRLSDDDGNLELVNLTQKETYDRDSYLAQVSELRQQQALQAARLLEQANQSLQAGEQSKANWALNSVVNQHALDAASNEDARVQLENLQTQQAIVGLNTRRQRLYLDNDQIGSDVAENEQLRQAAAANPILQQDQMNFRPQQLSQLLQGNTTADNAVLQQIAARLVKHQRTTEPAPQAIIISLPEEGDVYTFGRSVQVAENAALELNVDFASRFGTPFWRSIAVLVLLTAIGTALTLVTTGSDWRVLATLWPTKKNKDTPPTAV